MCEAKVHEPECSGEGAECDHIERGDDHSPSNLQWLSVPCHKAKTLAENRQRLTSTKLPRERHPSAH
jgi:5-methylcytosine-specific restriction protein A